MFKDLKDLFPDDFREFIRIVFLFILVIFVLSLLWGTASRMIIGAPVASPSPSPSPSPFAGIDLSEIKAKAVIVYDISNGQVIYGKNQDDILPIASLTKVMTAYAALSLVPPDTVITVRPEDLLEDGDKGLLTGEKWRLQDLIKLMLVSSSNDAASAIAAGVEKVTHLNFVLTMNNFANQLGLFNTRFRNPTGLDLDADTISGSYSTASDVAKLFADVYQNKPELFSSTTEPSIEISSLSGYKHLVDNTDTLIGQIPRLLASKTGTTDLAGGNLAVIFKPTPDKTAIVIVLGSSPEGRFSDMLTLTQTAVSRLANIKI